MNVTKIWLSAAVTLLVTCSACAVSAQVPEAVVAGPYAMRLQLVWLCAAVAASVYAVMIYGLMAAKRPGGTGAAGRVSSRRAELFWAVIPAVILIGLALPAVDTLTSLAAETQRSPVIADSSPEP
jgi:heme/copper-type cytochrome/quinol oxidase subunit 2